MFSGDGREGSASQQASKPASQQASKPASQQQVGGPAAGAKP